jgi:hypothetical protein
LRSKKSRIDCSMAEPRPAGRASNMHVELTEFRRPADCACFDYH